mmetsp:Transcript_24572/g.38576  ORF Transcript_24572/g.38576 Transcript_24572/m.38576 type:complete len:282 (-) Transcript_24572:149-994(-)
MTGTSSRCNYSKCSTNNNDQAANNANHLLGCGRCKSAKYCSTDCQKKDWVFHKFKCVAPEVTRHVIQGGSVEDIQSAIHAASPGDAVVIKKGTYEAMSGPLFVNKPIYLWGGEEDRHDVVLNCQVVIDESGGDHDGSAAVVVADFDLNGTVTISANKYKSVTLCNVAMKCPNGARDDALDINGCKGKCLILGCDIEGGSDGVNISSEGVHLKRSCIQYAQNRGIFSRRVFTIEDCEVSGCGGYGIKGSAGWTEKGRYNDIQPGPWSAWGGATESYGGFGGW